MAVDVGKIAQVVTVVGKTATDILSNEQVSKNLYGSYSDGTQRSMTDAFKGEYLSPKQKKKIDKKIKKMKEGKGTKFKL